MLSHALLCRDIGWRTALRCVCVSGCWWHSSVFGCGFFWLMAKRPALRPADRTPPPSQTSSLAVLPPKRFSHLSSRHPTLFLPLFLFFLSASAALPPALSPYTGSSYKAARSDYAGLSFPFPLGLSRSFLSIDPPPPRPVCTVCPCDRLISVLWAVWRLIFTPGAGVLMHPVTAFPSKIGSH